MTDLTTPSPPPAPGDPTDLGDPHIPDALAYFAAPRGRGDAKGPTGPLEQSNSPWPGTRYAPRTSPGPNDPYPPGDLTGPADTCEPGASAGPADTCEPGEPPASTDTCEPGEPPAPSGSRVPGERTDAHAPRATGSTSRHTPPEPNTPYTPGDSTGPTYTYQLGEPTAPDRPPENNCQDLRDRLDLRQLVDTYAYALDRRMAALFGSLFGAGGELVLVRAGGHDLVFDGRDGWARALAVLEPCRVTTHFVGNHLVRLAGDSATGETYCLAHEVYPGDGADRMRVRSIRYRDSYRRTEGSWLFTRRELIIDWTEDRVLRSPAGP